MALITPSFTEAVDYYKRNFKLLLIVSAATIGLGELIGKLLTELMNIDLEAIKAQAIPDLDKAMQFAEIMPQLLLVIIFNLAMGAIGAFTITGLRLYPDLTVGQALSLAVKRTPRAMLAYLILSSPLLLLAIVVVIGLAMKNLAGFSAFLLFLAMTSSVIMLVYFSYLLAMSVVIVPMLLEQDNEESVMVAIKRAFYLTKGRFWKFFGLELLLIIGLIMIGGGIGLLTQTIFAMLVKVTDMPMIEIVGKMLVESALITIYSPLIYVLYSNIYLRIKS